MNTLDPPTRSRAACLGADPDTWFPDKGGNGAAAKRVCATCPIRESCLLDAIERNEAFGVWGGAGEPDRRRLRRAWRIGGPAWDTAVADHWDALDSHGILDRNGPGATCGRRSTQARGCRCPACRCGPSWENVLASLRTPPRRRTATKVAA